MKRMILGMLGIFFLLPAISQAEIYKCTIKGKLVFTDQPCDGEKVILGETTFIPAETEPFVYTPQKQPYSSNQWYYGHAGYKRALKLFKKYDAPIFMYFQADWCGYCRKLEEGLINTRKGKIALKNAIKVRITPEDSKRDDAFFRGLGGTGYPTLYLQANEASKPKRISAYNNKKMITAISLTNLIQAQKL